MLDLGWAGDNRYRSVPRRINGIFSTPVINPILAVSGQFLYLLLATYGLFFVGLVYIYKYVIKKASKASWQVLHDNKFNILVLLLLTSFGVFLTSSANTLGCSRSDYLIYGRINEGFLALYIGLALISLYSERFSSRINWKRPFFTGLVIILLALIVVVGRGDEMLSKPATPVNVLGIFPLINILGMPNLIIISLILIVLSIVIFYAFKFRFVLGIYLLSIFFVFVTIYGYRFYFIPTMNFMKRISSLAPHVNSIDDINILSYDRSFYNPGRWFSYQYLMPGFVFEKFSSKKNQQPKSDIVISGKGWQDSEKLGAMFLYSENHVDQALWAMPGKIRDRFLRELDYFNINLGAESAPMVWESGFHGQEWWNSIPLRWTNGAAKLIVPLDRNKLPKALRIILGATGPNGSRLLVLVNNQSLFDEEIPAGSWHKIFSLTDISLGKQLIIELLSDTFVPKEIMEGSLDSRTLGVSVRSIKLLEKGKTDQLDPAL
ncbi:MAG: hypothetical protein GY864_09410 [Desulfobacterales bacterium]|nr:hypothetical protein [Desulfobacterales bacterium]